MRIQLFSDLHLELGSGTPGDVAAERELAFPDCGADVIVLAGDIAAGPDAVPWAAHQWPDRPVLYVLGNHEFYHRDVETVLAGCRAAAEGTNVHVLERDAVTLAGVRFLGATLWTDFALFGNVSAGEKAALKIMPDFAIIQHPETGILQPAQTRLWHQESLAWLKGELRSVTEPTVVITHHAPHRNSDHFGTTASAGFCSDLSSLICNYAPTLWLHGHTHGRDDYLVGTTRVVSNQVGYADEATGFDPELVLDVSGAAREDVAAQGQ